MGDDCCICELCSALFKKKSNLTRHIQNVHYREKKFMCEHCSKNYITKDALTNHITNSHSNKPRKKRIVYWQWPMCIHQCEKEQMVDHYKLFHNYDISTINIQFDSFNEFLSWKQKIEKQSSSKYIRHRKKKYSDKWKYFYRCHRDGFYRAKGNNLRKLKKIGSNKINAHCPAKIDVTINETNGKISINYFQNHIGHSLETFRLSSNCKEKADGEYTEETDSDNEEANELSIEEKSINERYIFLTLQ